jgi:heme-degrading monooxygenase HmoA
MVPPPLRCAVTLQAWDSEEKLRTWRNSAEFKRTPEIGNKLAKFRSFIVEGAPN